MVRVWRYIEASRAKPVLKPAASTGTSSKERLFLLTTPSKQIKRMKGLTKCSVFGGNWQWNFVVTIMITLWTVVSSQSTNASSPVHHQDCMKVYQQGVPGFTCVYLSRLSSLVGGEFLAKLWVSANTTETIEDGKARSSSLYLPPPPRRLSGKFMNLDLCLPTDPKEEVLTPEQRSGRDSVKGYLGNNLVPGRIVTDELLHHTTDVTRPDFPMDNLFLSSRMKVVDK